MEATFTNRALEACGNYPTALKELLSVATYSNFCRYNKSEIDVANFPDGDEMFVLKLFYDIDKISFEENLKEIQKHAKEMDYKIVLDKLAVVRQ